MLQIAVSIYTMFFRNVLRTFYDKLFYKESENDSFWKRYQMLYVVHLVLAIATVLSIANFYYTNKADVATFGANFEKSLPNFYPKDLVLTIKDGELSTNQAEPYYLGSEIMNAISDGKASRLNFITIDTNASLEDYETLNTAVLLTKKGIIMKQSERGEIRYYPYSQFVPAKNKSETVNFSYKDYMNGAKELTPLIKRIPELFTYVMIIVGIFVFLLVPLFSVSGWLLSLLFLSILGYFAAIIIKRKHAYGYIYKIGMYVAVPLTIFQSVHVFAGYFGMRGVPDLSGYTWLVYLLMIAIFVPENSSEKVVMQVPLLDPPQSIQKN